MTFRPRLSRLTFRGKINLGIAVIVVASGVLSAVLVGGAASSALSREIAKRGANLARNLAVRSVEPILTLDHLALSTIVEQAKSLDEAVDYVFIQDREGAVLAHGFKDGFPVDLIRANPLPGDAPQALSLLEGDGERILDFAQSVDVGGVRIGTARVGLSYRAVASTVRDLLALIAAITAVGVALALTAGSVFAARVTRRINLLRDFAERMVRGDLGIQAAPAPAVRCWEALGCTLDECPAHGDDRCRCWLTSGTLCDHDGQKSESCETCPVYLAGRGDELASLAESFDAMAAALKARIGDLERKEEVVNRQKRLLKTIFDVTPDLVCFLDENLTYTAVNKAFCDFAGLAEGRVLGTPDKDHIAGRPDPEILREDRTILSTLRPLSLEVQVERQGRRRWFHVVKVPVAGPEGSSERAVGLLVTARDITQIKAYQEQLLQSQKMESLGKLAGGVAHEINTPLAVILGYAQLLQDDFPPDSEPAKQLALIERHAKVCRTIVADLLAFSRQGESRMDPLDLNRTLTEVVSLVGQIFRQERVELAFRPGEHLPPVLGNPDRLKQVWMNLLNNAMDAVGPGGIIVASTAFDADRGLAVVRVTDSGVGIPEEHLARIFDPFFSTKPVGRGTGLGLSLSLGIIRDHGGSIRAESPAPPEAFAGLTRPESGGPGTAFVVELPVEPDPAGPTPAA